MDAVMDTLGQRILQAARMAVAVHLNQVVVANPLRGQRVVIGRAGPQVSASSPSGDRAADPSRDGQLPAGDRFEDLDADSPCSAEGAD